MASAKLLQQLSEYAQIETGRTFKEFTSFRVGGPIAYTLYPHNTFSLQAIISLLNQEKAPYKVIGNGTNLLCSEEPYEGFVVRLNRHLTDSYLEGNILNAMAGCSVIGLAQKAAKASLSGLEFASGIPGSVGGGIFMNAGAYKSALSDLIIDVTVLKDNRIETLTNEECGFGYRESVFQAHPDWTILSCRMKLQPGDKEAIQQLMKTRQQRRIESQPLEYPSAGSTFRNPEGCFCWQLIEQIGYRGKKIGGAQVSEKHCNFIINADDAKADDIYRLIHEIQSEVKEQCGIELVTEVEEFNWKH